MLGQFSTHGDVTPFWVGVHQAFATNCYSPFMVYSHSINSAKVLIQRTQVGEAQIINMDLPDNSNTPSEEAIMLDYYL